MNRRRFLGMGIRGWLASKAGLVVLFVGVGVAGYVIRDNRATPTTPVSVSPANQVAAFVDPFTRDPEPDRPETKQNQAKPAPADDPWIRELLRSGWEEGAARAVCDLNREWWTRLQSIDHDLVDRQLLHLAKLKRADRLSSFLKRHPESAGLLASVSDPVALAGQLDGADFLG